MKKGIELIGEYEINKDVEYNFNYDNLYSYADTCRTIIGIIKNEKPDKIICPLRGAYPPIRVVSSQIEDNLIEYVPTSEFLHNKEELVQSALEKIVSEMKEKGIRAPHILTVDTAITGSSIRRYRDLLKKYSPELMTRFGFEDLKYSIVKIWSSKSKKESHHNNIRNIGNKKIEFNDYNLNVDKLFCEDDNILLGIDYPFNLKGGKKAAYIVRIVSKNPINVEYGDKKEIYTPLDNQTTADIFVEIVKNELKNFLLTP